MKDLIKTPDLVRKASVRRFLTVILFAFLGIFLAIRRTEAQLISNATLSNTTIPYETIGIPTGATVQVTLSVTADVVVNIFKVNNFSDTGTQVASLVQRNLPASVQNNIFWNGLWLIDGDQARQNGNYKFEVIATSDTVTDTWPITTLLQITSVDIHSITVTTSLDANGQAAPPYTIKYSLAKDSLVTATIRNSSTTTTTPIRTLISSKPQLGEFTGSATGGTVNTLTWDGLDDNGRPTAPGVYNVVLAARDPSSPDVSITRTRSLTAQTLANPSTDLQTLFEQNVFVFPNPVRSGQATFQFQAVRDQASLSLKIYTINGDLVREQNFSAAVGNIVTYNWNATNQSGHKVGRGLYFYVVREEDPQGKLQTVKKLAVIQ